jgi:hypothetical protein
LNGKIPGQIRKSLLQRAEWPFSFSDTKKEKPMTTQLDEDKLEDDLLDVAVWCEYKHPDAGSLSLFVATQSRPVPGQLVIAVSDVLRSKGVQFESPVVRDAKRALTALGYSFDWRRGGDVFSVIEVRAFAASLSQHKRLECVARIEEVLS